MTAAGEKTRKNWLSMLAGAVLTLGLALVTGAPGALAQDAVAPAAGPEGSDAAMPETLGHAWQLGFQPAASPVMHELEGFHNNLILPLIASICAFVLVLLLIVIFRFNARANPVPSKNSHNTLIEVVWTVVPVLILVVIAIPSFRLLFKETAIPPDAAVTIKVTGKQWFWSYEYPDQGDIAFDAIMKQDADRGPGEPRLLATDNKLVVPVGKPVHVIVTAADVIHSWAVPSFGVKIDAVPGRLNETWFLAEKEGVYFGQCSELCGKDHAFMPIEVHVVSEPAYAAWLEKAKKEFAASDAAPVDVAAAADAAALR